jgi:excisionase family DNA binding protein
LGDLQGVEAVMGRFGVTATDRPAAEAELLSLQRAATTLGIPTSRLRRWADAGRIEITRTAGGHRRFSVAEVRRLVAEQEGRPVVRPLGPPSGRWPVLAYALDQHGRRLTKLAAEALYNGGPPGWFGTEACDRDRTDWLRALARSCRTGDYAEAFEASEIFLRRSYLQATRLLERVRFMEHCGLALMRALTEAGARRDEILAARRLFAALEQAHLDKQG